MAGVSRGIGPRLRLEDVEVDLAHHHGHDGVDADDHVVVHVVVRQQDGEGEEESEHDAGVGEEQLHQPLAHLHEDEGLGAHVRTDADHGEEVSPDAQNRPHRYLQVKNVDIS